MANNGINGLKQWFSSLQKREQVLVSTAGIITIILVFYMLIWAPLNGAIEENQKALANEQELVTWLQEQSVRAVLLSESGNSQQISGSLTQVVNQTTRGTSIAISRLQPIGENLQVTIDSVPFNDLLAWLDVLENRGVVILQSDIVDTDESGIVQVRRLQLGK